MIPGGGFGLHEDGHPDLDEYHNDIGLKTKKNIGTTSGPGGTTYLKENVGTTSGPAGTTF